MPNGGKYLSNPKVEFLNDGRIFQLLEPFVYIDPKQVTWTAPKDAKGDGASIPPPLWPLIGSPLTGKYRNASIIHDFYCSTRIRPWKDVHRMFYDAMITSDVPVALAKVMYAGVYLGGPSWSQMDIDNVNLGSLTPGFVPTLGGRVGILTGLQASVDTAWAESAMSESSKEIVPDVAYPLSEQDVQELKAKYENDEDPDLSAIEADMDEKVASLESLNAILRDPEGEFRRLQAEENLSHMLLLNPAFLAHRKRKISVRN